MEIEKRSIDCEIQFRERGRTNMVKNARQTI